jgi:CMP-N-acetylneuraminic acid synthetase
LLQPTCPLRSILDIDNSIDLFLSNNFDTLISVTEVGSRHPSTCYSENNGLLKSLNNTSQGVNRQIFEKIYWRNGSIYIFSNDTISKFNSIFGEKIGYYEMPEERSFNLDSKTDWELLESYLKYKQS